MTNLKDKFKKIILVIAASIGNKHDVVMGTIS